MNAFARYFSNLGRAFCGQATPPPANGDIAAASLRARTAELELDLRERDKLIQQMKREYAELLGNCERAATDSGNLRIEGILCNLCGPLASLAVLATGIRDGRDVSVADFAGLVDELEQKLGASGLLSLGRPGDLAPLNLAEHQFLGSRAVPTGSVVQIRLPGYRLDGKVLLKAMVTVKEG